MKCFLGESAYIDDKPVLLTMEMKWPCRGHLRHHVPHYRAEPRDLPPYLSCSINASIKATAGRLTFSYHDIEAALDLPVLTISSIREASDTTFSPIPDHHARSFGFQSSLRRHSHHILIPTLVAQLQFALPFVWTSYPCSASVPLSSGSLDLCLSDESAISL
jgi:hypothetical protein